MPALLLVGAITTVGLVLRLPHYHDSLFGDELSTYFIVTGHSLGRVIDLLQGNSVDLNPPLFFVLAWATEGLGDSPQLIRLGSFAAGIAAIPLTYLLGLWTVGRRAALVGAALVALSPFLIFYTTEARAYGLVLLLVILSTLTLLRALETRRVRWWAAYAACSCAVAYTHYPPVFLLAGQFAWAFWTRPDARTALVAANAAAALAYLPWLPTVLDNTGSPGAVDRHPQPLRPRCDRDRPRALVGRASVHPAAHRCRARWRSRCSSAGGRRGPGLVGLRAARERQSGPRSALLSRAGRS